MENQASELIKQNDNIISSLVLNGDIGKLSDKQKVEYYNLFCKSLNLNPVTQPFQILKLQGKEMLYATKDCSEQLRKANKISIIDMKSETKAGIYIVTVKARDKDNREDIASGAVDINNLKGNALANAIMKCETKAKRRVTLSISGLGMIDETETETIPNVKLKEVGKKDNPTDKMKEEISKLLENVYFDLSEVKQNYFDAILNKDYNYPTADYLRDKENLEKMINKNPGYDKKEPDFKIPEEEKVYNQDPKGVL